MQIVSRLSHFVCVQALLRKTDSRLYSENQGSQIIALSAGVTDQRRRKDFLIGGAQSETTHRVVSNLYKNL